MYSWNSYNLIRIGLVLRLFTNPYGFKNKKIIEYAESLKEVLIQFGFMVSVKAFYEVELFFDGLKTKLDENISSQEVNDLKVLVGKLEYVVANEARTKEVYVLTQDRFNLENLINTPEKMFSKDIFSRLPDLAAFDLSEGFKCLAFGRSTAAAFHILRATEATLKAYYFLKVRRNREKTPMWGNMIRGLRNKRGHDSGLLDRLDFIRTKYRNPTTHPEEKYSNEGIQDLLGICIDVLNSLGKSLTLETNK